MGRVIKALAAAGLVAAGGVGGFYWSEARRSAPSAPPAVAEAPAVQSPSGDEPVEIALTPEAIAHAGIKVAAAQTARLGGTMTFPAAVTSNAYRETRVSALVGGVATRVVAELGSRVKRGAPLAVVFSAELADAQTKYLAMQASFDADHRKLERSEKLLAVGAASRQELEEITAVHAAHETELAAARQRLLLLGLGPQEVTELREASQIVSEVVVRAPADGVVITRSVNPGQVVAVGQDLFVVADLAAVWVVGDAFEKDFAALRVGAGATITVPAYPGVVLQGRVAYIDPRVDPQTRTAKVRVEVPNADGRLRLGMFVTLDVRSEAGAPVTVVPRSAVQALGERAVVYVAVPDAEGRFVERPVRLGAAVGDAVEVLEGVKPGERIVVEGSFILRAEATRSGARGG
jgi:cobalt-zinc-cadmium efflux system membrane fusion protein